MSLEPDEVQARVVLTATLFRIAMPRCAAALVPMQPAASTKEILFSTLERGVWDLPEDVFADYEGDEEWAQKAATRPPVKVLVERALQLAISSQPR